MHAILTAAALMILLTGPVSAAEPLPALGVDPAAITVSGVSSGAAMAHQLHIAHSATVRGAGLVAGPPFHCAGSGFPRTLARALSVCASLGRFGPFLGPPDVARSRRAIAGFVEAGLIDDPANLSGDRVFLFSGTEDSMVPTAVVETVADLYREWIATGDLIVDADRPFPHAMIVTEGGNPCPTLETPFINDCDFDLAGAILRHLYPALPDTAGSPRGRLLAFDQDPFSPDQAALLPAGAVYIPPDCEAGGCGLHVALHGCLQSTAEIGDAFVTGAGYNRWADAGRIVMLYPQAAAVTREVAGVDLPWPNPAGCWDWWGFTGEPYDTRDAPQVRAVAAMIARLSQAVAARPE